MLKETVRSASNISRHSTYTAFHPVNRIKRCFSVSCSTLQTHGATNDLSEKVVDKGTEEFLQYIGASGDSKLPQKSKIVEMLENTGLKKPSNSLDAQSFDEDYIPDELLLPEQPIEFEAMPPMDGLFGFYLNPSVWFQKWLEYMHVDCGIPWGTAILVGGIVVKAISAPAHLKAERHFTKNNVHSETILELQRRIRQAKDAEDRRAMEKANNALYNYTVANKMPTMGQQFTAFGVQVAAIACQVLAVDRLASTNTGNMLDSSFAWIPHMALPDPLGVLPMICACSTFAYLVHINTRSFDVQSLIDGLAVVAVYAFAFCVSYLMYKYLSTLSAATTLSLAFNFSSTVAMVLSFRLAFVRRMFNLSQCRRTFSFQALKNHREPASTTNVDKSQLARERLKSSLADLKMLFKNPSQVKQKYEAMYNKKTNDLRQEISPAVAEETTRTAKKA